MDFGGQNLPHTLPPPPFSEGSHLDLGDGLRGGDLDGVEALGADEELHGGEGAVVKMEGESGLGDPPQIEGDTRREGRA